MSHVVGRPSLQVLDGIAKLYAQSLNDHGMTSKSVGWKDEASHVLRFHKLAAILEGHPEDKPFVVNDLGCGYGLLFKYLEAGFPRLRVSRYYGYDISEEMLGAAAYCVDDPRAKFIRSNHVTRRADYSFVSGTFNVRLEASNGSWKKYVQETLMDLAHHSRRGIAFNLLSTYVDWKQPTLFYADPFFFFDFCKREISPYVSLLHDYPLYEWTIIVRLS